MKCETTITRNQYANESEKVLAETSTDELRVKKQCVHSWLLDLSSDSYFLVGDKLHYLNSELTKSLTETKRRLLKDVDPFLQELSNVKGYDFSLVLPSSCPLDAGATN